MEQETGGTSGRSVAVGARVKGSARQQAPRSHTDQDHGDPRGSGSHGKAGVTHAGVSTREMSMNRSHMGTWPVRSTPRRQQDQRAAESAQQKEPGAGGGHRSGVGQILCWQKLGGGRNRGSGIQETTECTTQQDPDIKRIAVLPVSSSLGSQRSQEMGQATEWKE